MKYYTIKEAAKIMNLSASTLRYYDKEGLLPNIGRRESGYRIFSENDMATLRVIECLKKAGLSIKEIRRYIDLAQDGDASLEQRYQIFLERRQAMAEQMAELKKTLDFIDYKCWYYETAIEAGTESIHFIKKHTM